MCGLCFVITSDSKFNQLLRREIFEELLLLNLFRGDDATGAFAGSWDGQHTRLDKRGVSALDYVQTMGFRGLLTDAYKHDFMLGHTRKATNGARGAVGAHPHQHGHITLIHNGHINNWEKLPYPAAYRPVTDTDAIAAAFASAGYEETLAVMRGGFALVWHDARDKVIRATVNSERPLHFALSKDGTTLYGASEYEAIDFSLGRRNLEGEIDYFEEPKKNKQGKEIGKVYTIRSDDGKIKMEVEDVPFFTEPKVHYLPHPAKSHGSASNISTDTYKIFSDELKEVGITLNQETPFIPITYSTYNDNSTFGRMTILWLPFGTQHKAGDNTRPVWGVIQGLRAEEWATIKVSQERGVLFHGTPVGYYYDGRPDLEHLLRPKGGKVYITGGVGTMKASTTVLKDKYIKAVRESAVHADDWLNIRWFFIHKKAFGGSAVLMYKDPINAERILKHALADNKPNERLASFKGPGGTIITFSEMAKHAESCSLCSQPVPFVDWNDASWDGMDLVCAGCTEMLQEHSASYPAGFVPVGID